MCGSSPCARWPKRGRLRGRGPAPARRRAGPDAGLWHDLPPPVADIVAAAGLSNDAFYRHFPSKDALVAAILEDGTERLLSYLAHQMAKEATPEGRGPGAGSRACWTRPPTRTSPPPRWPSCGTRAPWARRPAPVGQPPAGAPAAEPVRRAGQRGPDLDATLVAHAVVGMMSDHLWERSRPPQAAIGPLAEFCLSPSTGRGRRELPPVPAPDAHAGRRHRRAGAGRRGRRLRGHRVDGPPGAAAGRRAPTCGRR